MPESVQTMVDAIQARVRDSSGEVQTDAIVMDILDQCQRIYSDHLKLVMDTTTITTVASQYFYSFATYLTTSISILSVKEGERDLNRLNSLSDLRAIDRNWANITSDRFECFLQLGETYLILWPEKNHASSVDVVSTKLTTALVLGNNLEISTERTPQLAQLVESILYLRQRNTLQLSESHLKEFQSKLSAMPRV